MTQLFSTEHSIAEFVAGTPEQAIRGIVTALRNKKIRISSTAVGVARVGGVTSEVATRAANLFNSIGDSMTGEQLAIVLDTADRTRSMERTSNPTVQIVWTGPETRGTLVRPTVAVLDEMLGRIRDNGEVLLVGYALTVPDESAMERVIDRLENATNRGASITLVLHSDKKEQNLSNLRSVWDVFTKKPKVYTWVPSDAHPYTSLHAKCLVVDRLDALVTSANFTFHGLESNLELGLRVLGPQAGSIFERFEHLIAEGILTEWTND